MEQHILAHQSSASDLKRQKVNFITNKANGYASDLHLANSVLLFHAHMIRKTIPNSSISFIHYF